MMEECLPRQQGKGKLVEKSINKLTVQQIEKCTEITSPSWIDLQSGASRVKKLSKLFEENGQSFHAKPNWWLDESNNTSSSSPTSKPRNSIGRMSNNSPKNLTTTLDRIIHEFLQKEITYLTSLQRGIVNYVEVIRRGTDDVPEVLRHHTFRLFANIEEIFKLHKESVYPQFIRCNGDPRLIAETISNFIQNDYFYCYIVYGLHHKSMEQLISQHMDYFERLRSLSDDPLGIHSLIIQPIQKLPRYKMLFDEMIKELGRDLLNSKAAAAACCVAEKNIQRILVRLNEALAINDIIEINSLGVEEQMNTITSLQNLLGLNINEPMLLVVPKASDNFPYRSPVNINDLGKFQKASIVKVYEYCTDRSFTSKVFIFEKCLLYTRVIKDNTIGYRNHFMFNATIGFNIKESQVSFRVNQVNKKQDVIFSSDNIESIAEIKKLIKQFHDPRRSNDSAFVEGSELMFTGDAKIEDDDSWVLAECGVENQTLGEKFKTMLKRFKN